MFALFFALIGMLIIGGLLGSLITQYLIKRNTSGGSFRIDLTEKGKLAIFVSFDDDNPYDVAKHKYIILEKED